MFNFLFAAIIIILAQAHHPLLFSCSYRSSRKTKVEDAASGEEFVRSADAPSSFKPHILVSNSSRHERGEKVTDGPKNKMQTPLRWINTGIYIVPLDFSVVTSLLLI